MLVYCIIITRHLSECNVQFKSHNFVGFSVLRFVPYEDVEGEDYEAGYDCYENSAVFIISMYQYIILAVVFAKGKPYRKSMFTNREC